MLKWSICIRIASYCAIDRFVFYTGNSQDEKLDDIKNKGLRRAQNDTTTACRHRKFEQAYFQVNLDALTSLRINV